MLLWVFGILICQLCSAHTHTHTQVHNMCDTNTNSKHENLYQNMNMVYVLVYYVIHEKCIYRIERIKLDRKSSCVECIQQYKITSIK